MILPAAKVLRAVMEKYLDKMKNYRSPPRPPLSDDASAGAAAGHARQLRQRTEQTRVALTEDDWNHKRPEELAVLRQKIEEAHKLSSEGVLDELRGEDL